MFILPRRLDFIVIPQAISRSISYPNFGGSRILSLPLHRPLPAPPLPQVPAGLLGTTLPLCPPTSPGSGRHDPQPSQCPSAKYPACLSLCFLPEVIPQVTRGLVIVHDTMSFLTVQHPAQRLALCKWSPFHSVLFGGARGGTGEGPWKQEPSAVSRNYSMKRRRVTPPRMSAITH